MLERLREEIEDERVIEAMGRVPREAFVPELLEDDAWEDYPLPLGHGLTLPQPAIVGLMTELADVRPGDLVLEIGTGSGYHAALLASLGGQVHSIDRRPDVLRRAREALGRAGVDGVTLHHGDGFEGLPDLAPFDVIVVTAAPTELPERLVAQLAPGGRLVSPVGGAHQQLVRLVRDEDGELQRKTHGAVAFMALPPGVDCPLPISPRAPPSGARRAARAGPWPRWARRAPPPRSARR